ncbi:endolytic transglycosylase MltG [Oscillibacter sp.]|uniref:endolytic transglycosylase MltG n=1 Tax=Oscillibacter sp. TaxID=1945593 RepID=UPI002604B6AD|nr:endolytic transglycosylase MltG [Oscillibacter sp.]MDD3347126.1 endolytic transglycosylase MltG [Oscillibacter sp.]
MADFKKGDTANWNAGEVRRAHAEQQRPRQTTRRKRKRRVNPVAYILFVVIASAILAGVGWLLLSDLCAFNRASSATATVEVTAEDTVSTIADKLQDAGLIKYKWFFRLFAGVADAKEKIGIGTYELNADMDYRALITGMRNASGNMNAATVRVTIPEGYTVAQTIALLAKNGVNTEDALLEAAKTGTFDYPYIDNDSEDLSRLEGFLFPDTYEFYKNEKPVSALERLISNFDRKMDEDRLALVESSGYNIKEILTIASLIEKETDGTDQRQIASVIYNRLSDNGSHGTYKMLNIDASLLYALPDHQGALTNEDKKVDSRYNLYKYAGLPPTPIANPGLASIEAALEPDTTDYYYYALGKDGKHRFSKTLQEHNAFLKSADYAG